MTHDLWTPSTCFGEAIVPHSESKSPASWRVQFPNSIVLYRPDLDFYLQASHSVLLNSPYDSMFRYLINRTPIYCLSEGKKGHHGHPVTVVWTFHSIMCPVLALADPRLCSAPASNPCQLSSWSSIRNRSVWYSHAALLYTPFDFRVGVYRPLIRFPGTIDPHSRLSFDHGKIEVRRHSSKSHQTSRIKCSYPLVPFSTMAILNKLALPIVQLFFLPLVASQCSSSMPIHLCCLDVEPYSSNSYVWENICGFPGVNDTSVLVAGDCSMIPWWVQNLWRMIHFSATHKTRLALFKVYMTPAASHLSVRSLNVGSKVCATHDSSLACPESTDGLIGLNCTATRVT